MAAVRTSLMSLCSQQRISPSEQTFEGIKLFSPSNLETASRYEHIALPPFPENKDRGVKLKFLIERKIKYVGMFGFYVDVNLSFASNIETRKMPAHHSFDKLLSKKAHCIFIPLSGDLKAY
ncbi:hypothetical protein EUGRSUZ_C00699 [Eucalyptus grandis]|uniref:Uncharacterized protein n=2 Tax=Eucalyptus grandis TaxID=71139 RepID=A0ACC3LB71_EUCGR|nr:hypothetical protein EUGRSUZ_C00699 [Eucalyptus grandis]